MPPKRSAELNQSTPAKSARTLDGSSPVNKADKTPKPALEQLKSSAHSASSHNSVFWSPYQIHATATIMIDLDDAAVIYQQECFLEEAPVVRFTQKGIQCDLDGHCLLFTRSLIRHLLKGTLADSDFGVPEVVISEEGKKLSLVVSLN